MELNLESVTNRQALFTRVMTFIEQQGLRVVDKDDARPWGGFLVIDESQASDFAQRFFPDIRLSKEQLAHKLSPKILMVQPHARLSWQYHHRRAEIWRLIGGEAGIIRSATDEQGSAQSMSSDSTVFLKQGERHRLIGLDRWGVVAEIWEHTDPAHPSNEEDIVRLQDDFGRS